MMDGRSRSYVPPPRAMQVHPFAAADEDEGEEADADAAEPSRLGRHFSVSQGSRFDEAAGFDSQDDEGDELEERYESQDEEEGEEEEEEEEQTDVDAHEVQLNGLSHRTNGPFAGNRWQANSAAHHARPAYSLQFPPSYPSFTPAVHSMAVRATPEDARRRGSHSRSSRSSRSSREASKSDDDDNNNDNVDKQPTTDGSDSEDDEEALKPLPRGSELLMRACMCGVSLLLLWATSFSLAQQIAEHVVTAPRIAPVVDGWSTAWDVMVEEGRVQERCLSSLFAECGQRLNESIIQRESEWRDSVAREANNTARVKLRATTCESAAASTLQAINAWTTAGATLFYRDSGAGMCPPSDIEMLRTILSDRRSSQQALSGLTTSFVAATSSLLRETQQQLRVLQDYNAQFVYNASEGVRRWGGDMQRKVSGMATSAQELTADVSLRMGELKEASGKLSECASKAGGANSMCPSGTLVDSFQAALVPMQASYASIQHLGNENLRALTQYGASVQRKFGQVQGFFNVLYPVANALGEIGINVFDIPSLDIPPLVPNADFLRALVGSVDLPPLGPFFSVRMAPLTLGWEAQWERGRAGVTGAIDSTMDDMASSLQGSLDDIDINNPHWFASYNPPSVSPQASAEQSERLRLSAQAFQEQSAASVQAIIDLPGAAQQALEALKNATRDQVASIPDNVTASLSFSLPPLSTGSLKMPFANLTGDFGFSDALITLLTAMGGVLVLGDYAYRMTGSVRVLRQYARAPAEMLPVIDARTQANKDAEAAAQSNSASTADRIAYYAGHAGLLVLVGIFLAWMLALAVSAYIPYYQAYTQGCVASHNGTFLSSNSHSVLYNFATLAGNKRLPFQLGEYEARRMMACGRYEQRYIVQQTDQSATITTHMATQRTAWQQMQLINKCLDGATSFNATSLSHSDSLNVSTPQLQYPDPLVSLNADLLSTCGTDLTVSSGSSSTSTSPFAHSFNCSWLPACTLGSCPGPSTPAIRSSTHDASCSTEYALHHALLYAALTLCIFACLNVSRSACIRAMVRLGWRALTPAGLTFLATCDHAGNQQIEKKKKKKKKKKKRRKRQRNSPDSYSSSGGSSDEGDESGDSASAAESSSSESRHSRSASMSGSKRSRSAHSAGAADSSLSIQHSFLRRSMEEYEAGAARFLLVTIVAHVPYVLLLLALSDPLGWGTQIRVAQPKPY